MVEKVDKNLLSFVECLACVMMPVRKEQLMCFSDLIVDWKGMEFGTVVKKLLKDGLLKEEKTGFIQYYTLHPTFHLELLAGLENRPEVVERYKKYEHHCYIDYYTKDKSIDFRNQIWAFVGGRDFSLQMNYMSSAAIVNLCRAMVGDLYWKPFFAKLPINLLIELFDTATVPLVFGLRPLDMSLVSVHYLQNDSFSLNLRIAFGEELSFYEYVLSGKVNEIPRKVTANTPLGTCAHALYWQYRGNIAEALKLYKSALKVYESNSFFFHPYYDVVYVLALMADTAESSKKKLIALSKKRELTMTDELMPVRLLLTVALQQNSDYVLNAMVSPFNMSALAKVLCSLIVRHYQLSSKEIISCADMETLVSAPHLKLLQLECSQDFQAFIPKADSLKAETGLAPLLPSYRKPKDWESVIELLLQKNGDSLKSVRGDSPASASNSRIFYLIDRFEHVIPRLQKSKDGITWSKGRNIALSTFKLGIPEMTDIDRQVAMCAKSYSGGWGSADFWELKGAKAFAALAGYPLVFQEENPDMPIVIVKEKLQLIVTKTSSGFVVDKNVGNNMLSSNTIVKKESDQYYQVIEMTSRQREMVNTLNKVTIFPLEAKEQLIILLQSLSKEVTIHSDLVQKYAAVKQVEGSAMITVRLQPVGVGIKAELFVKPFVDQPPYCKAGRGAISVMGTMDGKQVQAIRNFEKENANFSLISALLQQVSGSSDVTDQWIFDDVYQSLELLEALRLQADTVRTEWPEGTKLKIAGAVNFSDLSLSAHGAGQWFDIDGELKVNEKSVLKIGELLRKVRESKGRFIALNDDEFLVLGQQLRKQLEEMDVLLVQNKKKLQLPQLAATMMQEFEKHGVSLQADNKYDKLMKRIEESGQKRFVVPKTLQAELRGYQKDGFFWMSRLSYWGAGACLADDMGLGKTLQAIAMMLSRGKQGASMVVAPASVLINWKSEIERFAPSLAVYVLNQADCDRKEVVNRVAGFDVVLTTYGLLITEEELLCDKEWNLVILDEAHTIKNKETKMSKAAMCLKADFRLLLTGTPLQNHLGEIWNLFQFANPGLLGSFQHFNETFIQPIERNGDKERQRLLKKLLLPFILRRTKAEVLDELPQKTEITLQVELADEERALYENLRREAVLNLEEGSSSAVHALAEITRLRQAACHPALVNKKLDLVSAKSEAFLKLVQELTGNNHRALVFSQFTSHLALIKKELDKLHIGYLYLDGSISATERLNLVKEFQTGDQPLFLISLKAGGTGLNLTAADYVIHLDPWWNPAVEDQASDRAYRIGQTRPVTVYRLIASQTIEEKIVKLHQSKKSLADSLLDGSDLSHKLTREEMLELLRESGR